MSQCRVSLQLKNCQTETEKLCRCVEDFGKTAGLAPKAVFSLTLALEELFTNIVSYGFEDGAEHAIDITIDHDDGTLVVRLEDDGIPFNPETAEKPDVRCPLEESKIGGLGIHLAKKMVDEFVYERRNDKNIITMKKVIRSA